MEQNQENENMLDNNNEYDQEIIEPNDQENEREINDQRNVQENNEDGVVDEGYRLRDRARISRPVKYNDYELYISSHEDLPLSYKSSGNDPNWSGAITEEKNALSKNGAWILVDRKMAEGKRIITCMWIFKIKGNGVYKDRLVARGCQQKDVLDIEDKFSPVVDTTNLRMLFALAAQNKMSMTTFDA